MRCHCGLLSGLDLRSEHHLTVATTTTVADCTALEHAKKVRRPPKLQREYRESLSTAARLMPIRPLERHVSASLKKARKTSSVTIG